MKLEYDGIGYCEECEELGIIVNLYEENFEDQDELYEQCCVACMCAKNNHLLDLSSKKISDMIIEDNTLKNKIKVINNRFKEATNER